MNDLSVTTLIAAPPAKVWDAMVNRQEEWWCPKPWRAVFDVDEKRPGGRCDVTMYGPGGEVHPHGGIYLAFEEGRRFITTDAITGDFQPSGPFMIGIWEIAPEGDGTRYTATARHWREEDRKNHEEMGFVQGWGECARQLKELCEAD
jgi:uncharacterized protein YndB with AHSA1/START domain